MEFKELEKKLPWGIIGVILTLIFGGIGIYTYLNQLKPSLSFEIVRESNVFDVYKQIDDLEIKFKNSDIKEGNLNLRTYTIKIQNNGSIDILTNHYDPNIDWGIKLYDGEFLNDINLIASNSLYLRDHLKFEKIKNNRILFNKLIFEQDKFLEFEVLVLHNKNKEPILQPLGKIAGIEELKIINIAQFMNEKTFLSDLIHGSIFIHFTRFIAYILIFILLVFSIGIPVSYFSDKKRKEKKEKFILEMQELFGEEFEEEIFENLTRRYFYDYDYLKNVVIEVSKLKKGDNLLNTYIEYSNYYIEEQKNRNSKKNIKKEANFSSKRTEILGDLIDLGFLDIKKDKIKVNKIFLKNIDKIVSSLNTLNDSK